MESFKPDKSFQLDGFRPNEPFGMKAEVLKNHLS
jgi:hypothetical protein